MGACSSCLGRRRDVEDPETSRLLSDDPYRPYGSRNGRPSAPQHDPEHVRREREALENIAHGMSEEVVDIFTVLPESSKDVNQDRSGPSVPHINGFKGSDAEAQQIAYRSINRGSIDKISSQLSRNKHDWKDAKAVMG